ncbi:MAG TPA: low affinity iron permease family protein [Oculatellaceae cyanobacterium]
MFDHLYRHARILLQTDLGLVAALVLCFGWFAYRLIMHQNIDVPTSVTVLGFAMVFLIERAHAREAKAIHLKLDELLAALPGASNRLIKAEEAPESALHLAHHALHEISAEHDVHAAFSIEHTGFFDQNELVPPRYQDPSHS